mgnify:CR=1 FL=1
MAIRIQIARAWCDACLASCYQAYDESTGIRSHVGNTTADLGAYTAPLKERGFYISHRGGVYTATLYKSQPLALPLDWQMAIEERESVDVDQDW